jgi:poly-gamma-glutamate capsule biosynthesis protein CapA/YwtB (metallophosphatase superfamily)
VTAENDRVLGETTLRDPEGAVTRVLVAGDLYIPDVAVADPHPWEDLIATVSAHDVRVVNLECALSDRSQRITKWGPAMVAPAALAALAEAGGFNVASLANNHVLDAGADGLRDTLEACRRAGLRVVGAGNTIAEAQRPLIEDTPSGRVALVAVAEREFSIAGPDSPGAAPLDPWLTLAFVSRLRHEGDAVVVIVHGGNEMASLPRPGLVRACRALVDAGAQAVVCHHAHVPSGLEIYGAAPIIYGTGNFLFPVEGEQPRGWYCGYLVSLTLDRQGVASVRTIPYVQERQPAQVRLVPPAQAEAFLAELRDLSAAIANDMALGEAWQRFCGGERRHALGVLLGLSRPERALMRMGLWPWWRRRRRSLPALYDLLTCDSHRELVETLLKKETPLDQIECADGRQKGGRRP